MPTLPSPTPLSKDALLGLRILIVDDEPVLASTFCLVLQHAGAEAKSVGNGRAALHLLQQQRFDVILSDKHMPEMTGPEMIRELNRANDPTPILLFINRLESDMAQELRDLRIAGTLTKPLLPGELISAIRRVAGLL